MAEVPSEVPASEPVSASEPTPKLVAAVDLGSNSFHMKVARVMDGELQVVDRMREMVRLAAGLSPGNVLSDEAMRRAIDCLERFGQRLRDVPPESVRAVGTNTFRRARKAAQFVGAAQSALGHPIEVIDGREEARLIYLGVSHSVAADQNQRLVVDIGGGSTEFIIGREFTAEHTESLYMGCVSSSLRYFPQGRIKRRAMKEAEFAAKQELEPIQARYRRIGWDDALGASGTIRAIDQVICAQGGSSTGITETALHRLRDALVDAGHVDELELLRPHAQRAPVFPGGVAILVAVFEALGIRKMRVTEGALREGLLYDLIGRFQHHDVRETTIRNLSRRFQIDIEQAARVERTALYLHQQVAKPWRLRKARYRDLLGWAARLHEVGLDIAHNHYHKHGAYLLKHADLPGFSQQDKAVLADLVRAHRRKFPGEGFDGSTDKMRERARHLAVLLRIAVVLHRARTDVTTPGIVAQAAPGALRLAFPPGWLEDHPLTRTELVEEAAHLESAGIGLRVD